ncbi:hypothetical protein FJY90_04135 [Candidatus Gottesmanbacteria bacterium]|nr:hypothetical protein [Candidatus Gottesmanbacteria bacterium]
MGSMLGVLAGARELWTPGSVIGVFFLYAILGLLLVVKPEDRRATATIMALIGACLLGVSREDPLLIVEVFGLLLGSTLVGVVAGVVAKNIERKLNSS